MEKGENMKNRTILLMCSFVILVSSAAVAQEGKEKWAEHKAERKAFKETQKQENQAFRESVKDMSPEDRKAARKQHRESQKLENQDFRDKMHQEKIDHIQNNDQLTDEQKAERIKKVHENRAEAKAHHEAQKGENEAFRDGLSDDLSKKEKREAIKEHRETQKAENKALKKARRSERKAKRAKHKSK